MTTVHTERELDELPIGTRLRFAASGAILEKTLGQMWWIEGAPGAYMPCDIVMNQTPLEILTKPVTPDTV